MSIPMRIFTITIIIYVMTINLKKASQHDQAATPARREHRLAFPDAEELKVADEQPGLDVLGHGRHVLDMRSVYVLAGRRPPHEGGGRGADGGELLLVRP